MKFELTGSTSNLYFYAQVPKAIGGLWVEVMVVSFEGRPPKPRRVPRFYLTVNRYGEGEIAQGTWEPARTPKTGHGALSPDRVRRLVREILGLTTVGPGTTIKP